MESYVLKRVNYRNISDFLLFCRHSTTQITFSLEMISPTATSLMYNSNPYALYTMPGAGTNSLATVPQLLPNLTGGNLQPTPQVSAPSILDPNLTTLGSMGSLQNLNSINNLLMVIIKLHYVYYYYWYVNYYNILISILRRRYLHLIRTN